MAERKKTKPEVEVMPDLEQENSSDPSSALVVQEVAVKKKGRKKTEIDESLFDDTIEFITNAIKESVFKGSVEIGRHIFERYYGGDRELVSSRNPKKEASLRKLAARKDCPLTYSAIGSMLRVAVQESYLIENKVDVDKLHYTHKIKLLSIKDAEPKIGIANDIIAKDLSVKGAISLIAAQRKEELSQIEKKRQREKLDENVIELRRMLHDQEFSRFDFEVETMKSYASDKRSRLKERLDDAMRKLGGMKALLKGMIKAIETSDVEGSESQHAPQ